MAEISYPHADYNDGVVTEAEYAAGLGWATPSGLIGTPADASPLLRAGGVFWLRAGTAARLVGVAYLNDEDLPLTIGDNAAGAARVDHVVLRLDWATMLVRAAVLVGAPGGTMPALTQQRGAGVYEISIGQVTVPAGGSSANATFDRRCWYLGHDGVTLLCTADPPTRPPRAPGRRIHETDTGRTLESTGADWAVLLDDSGPATLTLTAGYVASRNRLRRRGRFVCMQLVVARETASIAQGASVQVATVPPAYRPIDQVEGLMIVPSGGTVGTYTVTTAGAVTVRPITSGVNPDRSMVLHPVTWPDNL